MKYFLAFILTTIFCIPVNATDNLTSLSQQQYYQNSPYEPVKKTGFDKNKLVVGGAFGLTLGNESTAFMIAPQIGYAFNPYITAGGGVGYSYQKYNSNSVYYYDYSVNYLGFNLYAKVSPIKYVSLQVQPELYGMWGKYDGTQSISRTVPCLLVGGGGTIPAGRGGISIMLLYDVAQNDWSPYGNGLVYSVGYITNF